MKKIIVVSILILFSTGIFSQPDPPSDLSGSELRTWLKTNWYNGYHTTLYYNSAREQMYGYIDKQSDGQVYCVYTGFHQAGSYTTYLDPINCEHTIPQSWFSEDEPMKSDIFHLFPTHQDVNSARGNLNFAEINDSQTDKWYIVNSTNTGLTILTSVPFSNIDNYSELNTSTNFEPREDHCGDAARAIFYFYTMYPTQAGAISNLANPDTLYKWHLEDPVDSWEMQRNNRTENSQGNRNPYIDHPDIACRAWDLECVSAVEHQKNHITIFPNPAKDKLSIQSGISIISSVIIYDILGKKQTENNNLQTNHFETKINYLNSGIYFIEITDINNEKILMKFIKE